MDTIDWIVLAAGLSAVAWVNWYFFFAQRTVTIASATAGSSDIQEVTVAVKGGYTPATVQLKRGTPVRMIFDRQETSSCSEEIVLPDFGIKRFLPAFQKTTVEFTPDTAGTFDFMCGMSMLHGKLIVKD